MTRQNLALLLKSSLAYLASIVYKEYGSTLPLLAWFSLTHTVPHYIIKYIQ